MVETHYKILEVRKNASNREIEQAYRRLVRKWHPDMNPDDVEARQRFQSIQAAFDVLHNTDRRRQYDLSCVQPLGTTEVSDENTVAKPGDPIVAVADQYDLDAHRFPGREPGTALELYRRRSRIRWLADWLSSPDFIFPLLLVAVFMGIQFVGLLLDYFGR